MTNRLLVAAALLFAHQQPAAPQELAMPPAAAIKM